jgi:hypothetical protein
MRSCPYCCILHGHLHRGLTDNSPWRNRLAKRPSEDSKEARLTDCKPLVHTGLVPCLGLREEERILTNYHPASKVVAPAAEGVSRPSSVFATGSSQQVIYLQWAFIVLSSPQRLSQVGKGLNLRRALSKMTWHSLIQDSHMLYVK